MPEAPVSAAHTITGDFATVGMGSVLSPTLDFSLLPVRTDQPRILVSRAADAYSRYAASAGAASLGRALAGIAGEARGDMRNLLAAADWSARDGSGVRQALGEVLFAAVAAARLAGEDPEEVLNEASDAYIARFALAEQEAARQGRALSDLAPEETVRIWKQTEQQQDVRQEENRHE